MCGIGPVASKSDKTFKRKVTNYRKSDWININRDLTNTDWGEILKSDSVSVNVEKWTSHFTTFYFA